MSIIYIASTAHVSSILATVRRLNEHNGRAVTGREIVKQIARDCYGTGQKAPATTLHRRISELIAAGLLVIGKPVVVRGKELITYELSQVGRESLSAYIDRLTMK